MKKLLVCSLLLLQVFPQLIKASLGESLGESSVSILVSPSYVSEAISGKVFLGGYNKTFDEVLAKDGKLKAKEILTAEGMVFYKLEPEDILTLERSKVGVLISKGDKLITYVPSDVKYDGIINREIR